MSKKKMKSGPKPRPADERRSVTLPAVRVTPAEMEELRRSGENLSTEIRRRLFG